MDSMRRYYIESPDGISTTPNALTLPELAIEIMDFPTRYFQQGYYSTNSHEHIPPDELLPNCSIHMTFEEQPETPPTPEERRARALDLASRAFGATLAACYPQATAGDVDPITQALFEQAAKDIVNDWIDRNVHAAHKEETACPFCQKPLQKQDHLATCFLYREALGECKRLDINELDCLQRNEPTPCHNCKQEESATPPQE